MLKSFFLAQAWGNFHALLINNNSYQFNPYTLQLEPIIRDQYGITKIKNNQTIFRSMSIQMSLLLSLSGRKKDAKITFQAKETDLQMNWQLVKQFQNTFKIF